jgi:hypothetical protein
MRINMRACQNAVERRRELRMHVNVAFDNAECAAVSRLCWLQADIVSTITFVDGAGTIRRVARNSRVGRGLAGGLGMLGVITEVTLQLTPGLGKMRSWSTGPRSDANIAQELLQMWVSAAGINCRSCNGCRAEQAARPTAALLHACVIALLQLPIHLLAKYAAGTDSVAKS